MIRLPSARNGVRPLFVLTILSSAFLLFLVQPMIARMALPRLGGAPAVWNSAMLVYQALLLAGYGYAHWLGRLEPRLQGRVHIGVLLIAALWLPIGLGKLQLGPGVAPAFWVPLLLVLSIGPLFFAVSAQSPLLQRWFSLARKGQDPYALYAASNLGSFAGLIAYPLVVEPAMTLFDQRILWSSGYILLALLVALCAGTLPRDRPLQAAVPVTSAPPGRKRIAHWILLASVPSGLMLATSTYITTDIVAMPLLWVIPLALYLLSFTIAFARDRTAADIQTRIAPVAILLFGGILVSGMPGMPYLGAIMALALLFLVSVALHTALYRLRPEPDRLTGFYLAMSFGGALGGVFSALVAPMVFDWTYEYPILILAAGILAPHAYLTTLLQRIWQANRLRRILPWCVALIVTALVIVMLTNRGTGDTPSSLQQTVLLSMVAIGILSIGSPLSFGFAMTGVLIAFGGYQAVETSLEPGARTRSYFGIYTVHGTPTEQQLAHGTTVHGTQLRGSPERERTPTAYYVPGSGIGQAMQALPTLYGPRARVGVVGLGTGTLACYARPGQDWRFYEIDPAIVHIARDSGQFSFLSRCLPDPKIIIGDARINIAAGQPDTLDLLALDAFSSDSVPMHLMTREAFASYARVLSPSGLLLVHVSNRFLDLEPVVAAAATAGGWHAITLFYTPPVTARNGATMSQWIALSRDPATIRLLQARNGDWKPTRSRPGFVPWTDGYSTILPLVKGLD